MSDKKVVYEPIDDQGQQPMEDPQDQPEKQNQMTQTNIQTVDHDLIVPGYGDRGKIKELATRLQKFIPGGQRLSENEALTLAQVAIAHQLDPFNGEVWYLKKKDGTPVGVMIGVKGLRKCARRTLKQINPQFTYWLSDFERLTADELENFYNIDGGAIGFRVKVFDTQTYQIWLNSTIQLKQAGFTRDEIDQMVGMKPYTVGTGIFDVGEKSFVMKPFWVAQKRAEADALKRRFDVPLGTEYDDQVDVQFDAPEYDDYNHHELPESNDQILDQLGY